MGWTGGLLASAGRWGEVGLCVGGGGVGACQERKALDKQEAGMQIAGWTGSCRDVTEVLRLASEGNEEAWGSLDGSCRGGWTGQGSRDCIPWLCFSCTSQRTRATCSHPEMLKWAWSLFSKGVPGSCLGGTFHCKTLTLGARLSNKQSWGRELTGAFSAKA